MKSVVLALTALGLFAPTQASAEVVLFSFNGSGPWELGGEGWTYPYGMNAHSFVSGNITVDRSRGVIAFNAQTGNKTWNFSDVNVAGYFDWPADRSFPTMTLYSKGLWQPALTMQWQTWPGGGEIGMGLIGGYLNEIACGDCISITSTTYGITGTPTAHASSLIGAFGDAVSWIKHNPTPTQMEEMLEECATNTSCNLDEAIAQYQAYESAGLAVTRNVAVASESFVSETNPIPTNWAEVLEALFHSGDILQNALDASDLLFGDQVGSHITIADVFGSGQVLTTNGLSGDWYQGTVSADVSGAEVTNLLGQSFITELTVGGKQVFGTFTAKSNDYDAVNRMNHLKIDFQLADEMTASVPEPKSWALALCGFGMVGGAMRSRRRAAVTFA